MHPKMCQLESSHNINAIIIYYSGLHNLNLTKKITMVGQIVKKEQFYKGQT